MARANKNRTTDRKPTGKNNENNVARGRTSPLALLYWILVRAIVLTTWLVTPGPRIQAAAERIQAAELPQAELDARAPLTPQELAVFPPGKRADTARRVFQVTSLLSQGGSVQPTVRHIARVAGSSERTIQRAHRYLESIGLLQSKARKVMRDWTGPRGQKYRRYNLPNAYVLILRSPQGLLRFVTPSRKNLNLKTTTPQKPSGYRVVCGKPRPENHPAAFRAALEARWKANHPKELRERYEARAAMWEHMRGWRPTAQQRENKIFERAHTITVGVAYVTEGERLTNLLDTAQRCGLSARKRAAYEAEWRADLAGVWDTPRTFEGVTVTEDGELRAATFDAGGNVIAREADPVWIPIAVLKIRPKPELPADPAPDPGRGGGVLLAAAATSTMRRKARKQAGKVTQKAQTAKKRDKRGKREKSEISPQAAARDSSIVRQPSKRPAAATQAAADPVCELCDGRRRLVVGGRIVVCKCSPDDQWRVV